MTYNDIDMSSKPLHPNCQVVNVLHHGKVSEHLVHGQTYEIAKSNLIKTGWFVSSSRSIVS